MSRGRCHAPGVHPWAQATTKLLAELVGPDKILFVVSGRGLRMNSCVLSCQRPGRGSEAAGAWFGVPTHHRFARLSHPLRRFPVTDEVEQPLKQCQSVVSPEPESPGMRRETLGECHG